MVPFFCLQTGFARYCQAAKSERVLRHRSSIRRRSDCRLPSFNVRRSELQIRVKEATPDEVMVKYWNGSSFNLNGIEAWRNVAQTLRQWYYRNFLEID